MHLIHGTYLQDWLLTPEDDNWRVDSALGGASRTFADIGSHWCDLAEFVTGQRITRAERAHEDGDPRAHVRRLREAFTRADGQRRGARRSTTEDAVVAAVRDRRRRARLGVISQISAGRKNRLWLEVDAAARVARLRAGERGVAVDRPPRGVRHRAPRRRAAVAAPPRASPRSPAATRRATRTASTSSSPTSTRRSRPARAPDGLPVFADGLRAAQITDAVLASARSEHWVDVAPVGVRAMKLGFLTACMPERPLEEIARFAAEQGYEALELAAWPGEGNRPFVPPRRRRGSTAPSRERSTGTASAARRSPTTTTTCIPIPPSARRSTRTSASVHRRRRRARRRAGRHVHRARPGEVRRRQPARGRAGLPGARRLRRRARREADDRELRDGGLAPRRLPRQPRVLARAVGVDVRASGCT